MAFFLLFLTLILTLYSMKNSGTMDANRYRITLNFDKSGHFNAKKVTMDFASLVQILPPQPLKGPFSIRKRSFSQFFCGKSFWGLCCWGIFGEYGIGDSQRNSPIHTDSRLYTRSSFYQKNISNRDEVQINSALHPYLLFSCSLFTQNTIVAIHSQSSWWNNSMQIIL